jgi:hypothetical protein
LTPKPKYRFLRFLLRSLYVVFISFLFVVILLFIFIQTDFFNRIVLSYSIKELNDSWKVKESSIDAERLDGNVLSGLTLTNAYIIVKGDTMMKAGSVSLKYDIFGFLRKEIFLKEVVIDNPELNITNVRGFGDSVMWNIAYLFGSEEEKPKDTTAFDWDVVVKNLKIHNGMFRFITTKTENIPIRNIQMPFLSGFDLNNLDVTNFEIELEGEYHKDSKILTMKNLSFNTNSDFDLKQMSFVAKVTDGGAELRNLVVKTNRSDIFAENLTLEEFNPFDAVDYEKFGDYNTKVVLNTKQFNFADLKFFVPAVSFLDSSVSLELNAEGGYKNLAINKLILRTPNSHLDLKGRIDNLNAPDKLFMDLTVQHAELDPSDTRLVLPGLDIPDYSHVGKVRASFHYVGQPLNFSTDFKVNSDAGSADGLLSLNLNPSNPVFKTNFETHSLDLGRILKNKELEGPLNLRAEVNGSGFDFNSLSARINYEISSSRVYGVNVTKSAGHLDIRSRNVEGEIAFQGENMQAAVKGSVALADFSNPKYSLKGAVRNFDVSAFTKEPDQKSNLDFTFDVNGRGISLDDIDGTYRFVFNDSYFGDYNIPATPVDLRVNNSRTGGLVDLKTNFFDFNAKGRFNLGQIADVVSYNAAVVTNEIEKSLNPENPQLVSARRNFSDFDFEYEFITKDSLAIAHIFKEPGYNFTGKLTGQLRNSQSEFVSSSQLDFPHFAYFDSVFAVRNLSGFVEFKNDYTKTTSNDFDALSVDVQITGNRLLISHEEYDTLGVTLNLADRVHRFDVFTRRDTTLVARTIGSVQRAGNNLQFTLDSISLQYQKYRVYNEGSLIVSYDSRQSERTFTAEQFNLIENSTRLNAIGKFSLAGESALELNVKNLKLAQLVDYLYSSDPGYDPGYTKSLRGNLRRIYINFSGNFENPVINFEMNSDLLRYNNTRLGRLDAFIDYQDAILSTDFLASNAQGSGKLRLTGNIPMANPFVPEAHPSIWEHPVDFRLTADNFQLNFISRLIPNFTDVRGILNGEITSKGTVGEPILFGQMNVTNGGFLLPLTGMYYRFTTDLRTENSNLTVQNFRILNDGDASRHIDVTGNINFAGLKVNDINLNASGELAVIDPSVDYNDLGIYGTVIAATGTPPVSLKGNLENLMLEGQFIIQQANITSITLGGGTAYDIYNDNFIYQMVPDSVSATNTDSIIYVSPEVYYDTNPFARQNMRIAEEYISKRKTNLDLNLNVRTYRNLVVSISYGSFPRQEFVGEVKADVDIYTSKSHELRMFGNVEIVGPQSYFRFYRNFKVEKSRLSFTGPPDNPEISFHAEYQNQTASASAPKVRVVMDLTGTAKDPQFHLKLYENDNEVSGQDAQADAISYLVFGVPKSQLQTSQRDVLARNVGATTGTSYLSGVLSDAFRSFLPFVVNTEISYTEGGVLQGTDIRFTTAFGDAIVKVGGRIFSDLNNTEITVEYPLNKLFKGGIFENMVLEISRTADWNVAITGEGRTILTGAKLLYILRY